MEINKARKIVDEIVEILGPHCEHIQVAGSVRRRKPVVKDMDIVLIPKNRWDLDRVIMRLGKVSMSGMKLSRVTMDGGVQVDIYFATPENFATLLLIRTGSVQNNIRLCDLAKKKGWHLFANGSGLFNERGERIAGDSERSIYEALGLRYQQPWERG